MNKFDCFDFKIPDTILFGPEINLKINCILDSWQNTLMFLKDKKCRFKLQILPHRNAKSEPKTPFCITNAKGTWKWEKYKNCSRDSGKESFYSNDLRELLPGDLGDLVLLLTAGFNCLIVDKNTDTVKTMKIDMPSQKTKVLIKTQNFISFCDREWQIFYLFTEYIMSFHDPNVVHDIKTLDLLWYTHHFSGICKEYEQMRQTMIGKIKDIIKNNSHVLGDHALERKII
jgi:hypothetical protein